MTKFNSLMQYHLKWYHHPADGETEETFDTEGKMLLFINHLMKANPKAKFSAMWGHKVEFEPVDIIASYRVKK